MNVNISVLGKIDYAEALAIQQKLHELRLQNQIEDTFLLLEHPPVLTLGTRGVYSNILLPEKELEAGGVKIYEVNRGGDVTYHGPGQIVGYPVMDLKEHGRDIKQFVWNLEEVFIRLLKENFEISAYRDQNKYTGVWVDNNKITAIGIAVKRWVTMHGFAFNVNTNLEHFKWINPCGILDKGVTSLEKLTGSEHDISHMNELLIKYFTEIFGLEYKLVDIKQLI